MPAFLLTLGLVATATACGAAGASTGIRGIGRPRAPDPTQVALARAATAQYRQVIDRATSGFAVDVGRLQADVDGGDTAAARLDELRAQSDYDSVLTLNRSNVTNASTLDGEADAVSPGQSFGGLHAVERDLWAGPATAAVAAVAALAAQTPVVQFLLARISLDPEPIATTAVDELNWVDDQAIPGQVELYAHRDAVDIVAGVDAADAAFATLVPLGQAVAPAVTGTVQRRFATLVEQVGALGDPTQLPDTALSGPTRLALSREIDATAAGLALFASDLAHFGTRGLAAYS